MRRQVCNYYWYFPIMVCHMFSVPFPVVTLLALLFLLVMTLLPGKPRHRGTLHFLVACVVLLSVSMLRWEYDSIMLRNIQSGLAMFLPPVAWHSFISMTDITRQRRLLLLFVPAAVSLCIRIVWPVSIDFILIALFAGYGCSLFRIAWQGEQQFTLSRLEELSQTTKMAFFAGCFLCISAVTDLLVVFDFDINGGKLAPGMVVIFQIILLPLIGIAIISAGRAAAISGTDSGETPPPACSVRSSEDVSEVYTRLETQVREKQLYLNSDLTLSALARKTGIPARHLSGAVNAVKQCNVSQWVNGFRIERAKELLLSSSLPVTEIMLESGFITKSNFNREFQRVTGVSPTLFRQQARDNSEISSGMN
ncbi:MULTISPECIES: helix-turn-helix domain-containing protein [Dickeya]|uniref:helix-turn-helix domain-containing protein n=1 Tax=Dickeya TaxID=204037 RepID=UPI001AECB72C|nr:MULTISPECIES: helix-turn-helix domain-containing protein [Dickeya]MBP2836200.1 helix-turn-helix transcriptional regulator [Dickeya parazeae]UCZ75008.1 AraC family transcriptional regulator [Dickeya zeae]